MFNKDFYPTPSKVIHRMIRGLALQKARVLEPSAGSGNIVSFLAEIGVPVDCCEINPDLQKIVERKGNFIQPDFMTLSADQCSHYTHIIANPPFSVDDKHILKMWEISPEGCQIVTLCNYETIRNPFSRTRKELASLIKMYGTVENLGEVFSDAERSTDVEVGLIKLQKPSAEGEDFSKYFSMDGEPEGDSVEGLMGYNAVMDIVMRVTGAMTLYEKQLSIATQMNDLIGQFTGIKGITFVCQSSEKQYNRNNFRTEIQRAAWVWVFNKMNMNKYLTTGVMKDINQFINTQKDMPFTRKNIYKMFDMVIQTYPQQIDKSIKDVFERLTSYYHENRYNVEGWKTNSHYLINKKFILPYLVEPSYSGGFRMKHSYSSSNTGIIDDFVKVLCYLTGVNYNHIADSFYWITPEMQPNTWYSLRKKNKIDGDVITEGEKIFWEFKFFKKGTMHFRFIDMELWARFNREVGRIYGFRLPEKL